MGRLSKYIRKHHKPFGLSVRNGQGRIKVEFYEGYVVVVSRQPGVRFQQEVAITRSAWYALLRRASGPTKMMEGPDFDRYQAERESYALEQVILVEKRERKKLEDLAAKKVAQRARYLRAKARARKKSSASR
jgi:hypothetical protein